MRGGGGFARPLSNSNASPTTTNNARNTKDTEHTDENFNSFNYWRSPLPDISGDLEMLNSDESEEMMEQKERKEEELDFPDSKSSPGKATSDKIQKVLDCLQPHIDDPDVQGGQTESEHVRLANESLSMNWRVDRVVRVHFPPAQVQVLSAALKAAQLDSTDDDDGVESPSVEVTSVEVQSASEESPTEEEPTMKPPAASESSPVQEQGDEETQTEDQEESPPDSPILVRDGSDLLAADQMCSVTNTYTGLALHG